ALPGGAICGFVSHPTDAVTSPAPPAAAPARDPASDQNEAARLFSLSIVISGTRCLLTYIVFPWVLPLLGIAGGVGPAVGVVVVFFNILSIRRWRGSKSAARIPLMTLNSVVIVFLLVLVAIDVSRLVS